MDAKTSEYDYLQLYYKCLLYYLKYNKKHNKHNFIKEQVKDKIDYNEEKFKKLLHLIKLRKELVDNHAFFKLKFVDASDIILTEEQKKFYATLAIRMHEFVNLFKNNRFEDAQKIYFDASVDYLNVKMEVLKRYLHADLLRYECMRNIKNALCK